MIGSKKNTTSRLRHRLTLQQEVLTADGAGGYTRSWQNVADLWAEITKVSNRSIHGRESFFAGGLQAEITHKVTIRYRTPISADMRLLFESRIFNIRTVNNVDEKNDIIEMLVEEGVA